MSVPSKSNNKPENFVPNKIFLLTRIFTTGYDEYKGKVVIASSAKAARKIANMRYGNEGAIWTNPKLVFCMELSLDMPVVVLESFNNG